MVQNDLRGSMGPKTLDSICYCKVNMMFNRKIFAEYYGAQSFLKDYKDGIDIIDETLGCEYFED